MNTNSRCYLPISLGTKPFKTPTLDAIVKCVSENFSNCTVLVCDSIYRLSLQITEDLSSDEAKAKAMEQGEEFVSLNRGLFDDKMHGRYKFIKTSDLEHDEYRAYLHELKTMLENDKEFFTSIDKSAADYVGRRLRDKGRSEASMTALEMMELSRQYLLEEMAMFALVINNGWGNFDVYPGPDLEVMTKIKEGKFPNIIKPLMKRESVEIKIYNIGTESVTASITAVMFE